MINDEERGFMVHEGQIVPGVVGRREAEASIAEYRDKLGETWTFEPLSPDSNAEGL